MLNVPKNARETTERMVYGTAESLKNGTLDAIINTKDAMTSKGAGVSTELKRVGTNALKLPLGASRTILKSSLKLLTLQPLKATGTAIDGLRNAIGDSRDLILAPIPVGTEVAKGALNKGGKAVSKVASLGGGAVSRVASTTKNIVKLPITAPIAAVGAIKNGIGNFGKWAGNHLDPFDYGSGAEKPKDAESQAEPSADIEGGEVDKADKLSAAIGIPTGPKPGESEDPDAMEAANDNADKEEHADEQVADEKQPDVPLKKAD